MAVAQRPFCQRRQFFCRSVAEDGFADIKQVDAAIEFARADLGASMSPFGDESQDPIARAVENSVSICEVSLYSTFRRQMHRSRSSGITDYTEEAIKRPRCRPVSSNDPGASGALQVRPNKVK